MSLRLFQLRVNAVRFGPEVIDAFEREHLAGVGAFRRFLYRHRLDDLSQFIERLREDLPLYRQRLAEIQERR